ncbi:hypothetical protein P152DRAFT_181956 [Eremomyces bilateralis CBS 781.70]|uniref:NTF2 domain-containing protein n=1 Tax=Eremomyces bilateralis CBS 781.70 TaxID=1392243 RepID=A0A6G1GBA4_9PEZI|nr:uncharacterized protein P152DRAFT_181956 [Eremomyces bilateralis CBS 781.70]KAF1815323.1 hypothetical protein P152DRAFT_181956 [Eremomyces bilateralis CBS 781.70]
MATEVVAPTINGSYAGHSEDPSAIIAANHGDATTTTAADGGDKPYPAEQVAWLFLEQYYTTLSHDPEKLYLFYNKRSQFIYGIEEEKVPVCIGQRQINERIKQIDCQFAKVRITNVDSQASDNKILIQVIGEMSLKASNKAEPPRRFVHSFILAEQSNGYFVLNDIFRSLKEDDEEYGEEPAAVAAAPAEEPVTAPERAVAPVSEPTKADDSAEGAVKEEAPAKEALVNGNGKVGHEPAAPQPEAAPSVPEPAVETPKEVVEPVKPKEPEQAPVPTQPKPAPAATPSAPPKPAAPKTWASLAASANKVATPAISASVGQARPAAAPKAEATHGAPTAGNGPSASSPSASKKDTPTDTESAEGWQTAGTDHHKKTNRQSTAQPAGAAPADSQVARAYIKNVYDTVGEESLRAALEKFGIQYCDISRPKNCAFVDFATQAGFNAAVAANPHQVGTDQVYVEERRVRPASGFFGGRGMGSRGRGGIDRGRGGVQGGRGRGGVQGGRGTGGRGGQGVTA